MQRAICERCGARQPPEWKAGDLCGSCGAQVRHEVRCPWCVAWIPAQKFCRACGCETVAPELFGAARMLKDAGVDRLTLAERMRTLDPGQIATFSAIYASHWAAVMRRVDEAHYCELFLLQDGWAADLEEEYAPRLPLSKESLEALSAGPAGPFREGDPAGTTALLAEIETKSPHGTTRELATLALLRRGGLTRERYDSARGLAWNDDRTGVEAALTFADWRVHAGEARFWSERDHEGLVSRAWLALRALEVPRARPYAALASAWAAEPWRRQYGADSDGARWIAALEPILREALASADRELAFGCALVLHDAIALAPALGDADTVRRGAAREALASQAAPLVLRRMSSSEIDDKERLQILQALPRPHDAQQLDAVLEALRLPPAEGRYTFHERAVEWLRETTPWKTADAYWRERVGSYVLGSIAVLGVERVLKFLEWATTRSWEDPWPEEAEVGAFLDATRAALDASRGEARIAASDDVGFRRLLLYAREKDWTVVDAFLRDPATLKGAWQNLRWLDDELEEAIRHHAAKYTGKENLAQEIFLRMFDALGPEGRLAWVRSIHPKPLDDLYPMSGHNEFLAAMWARFKDSDDDRSRNAIRIFLRQRFRGEFDDLLEKELPGWPLGGADPGATLELEISLEPERVYDALDMVLKGLSPENFPAMWRRGLELAATQLGKSMRALPPIGRLVREIESKVEDDPLSPAAAPYLAELEPFRAAARALARRVLEAGGEDHDWGVRKVEELEEDFARIDNKAREAREAIEARAREEQEKLAREAERLAAEKAAEEDRRRREEEAARVRAEAGMRRPPGAGGPPGSPVDDEPFFPQQPLKTVAQYAAFMRALQKGGDVMATMAAWGVDPMRWGEQAMAWMGLFQKRTDLALRFAALLQAPETAAPVDPPRPPPPPPPPRDLEPPQPPAPDPLDDETLAPGLPLDTLKKYARFTSGDRFIELDAATYSKCLTAWGSLFRNRPDVAKRYGALLA